MKSVNKIWAALVFAALLLSSCGLIGGQRKPAEEPVTVAVEENKVPGGDLFIAMPSEIESFDPLIASSEDLINLLTLIYEAPLKYESDGRLVNWLVESWETNEARTTFTFTLRDDVYFSDGVTKLTADDVIYSAERVMALDGSSLETSDPQADGEESDPEAAESADPSPSPEQSGEEEGVPEEPPQSRYAQFNGDVAGMKKIDERTVELTMNKPGGAALNFMTFPVMSELLGAGDMPVGTGPYKVETYEAGVEMALARNESWWRPRPYIDKIVAKAVLGTEQKLEMEQGSIVDFITTDVLYSGKYRQPQKTQVIDYMTNYYDCLIPNQISPELKDVRVRQAISYAIDRGEILSTVLLNHGVPANLPIAPDFFACDSKYKISDHDRNTAKEMLEEAGYRTEPDGEGALLELDIIVPNDRNQTYKKEAVKAIRKQLAEVGIELRVFDALTPEEYVILLETGNFDLAYCSYYLDIAPDVAYLFGPEGVGNYGHVQNDEINAAIQACELAVTEEEMTAAYTNLQRALAERVPQIGLYYRMNSIICDDGVRDIQNPRQNAVFANIAEWYISYVSEAAVSTATPSVEPGQAREAPPEESGVS